MVLDGIAILGGAMIATLYELHTGQQGSVSGLWRSQTIDSRQAGILLALLFLLAFSLIVVSQRLHLYSPSKVGGILHEQWLTVQACFAAGLLLTGTAYLIGAESIPRSIILTTLGLVTLSLSLRRLAYRAFLYLFSKQRIGIRNAVIIGAGPTAHALRDHMQNIPHLGYRFKGFVDFSTQESHSKVGSSGGVGSLEAFFQDVRGQAVDEIFFTAPCERDIIRGMLKLACVHGVDLRIVPDLYDGLTWNGSIEYIGHFPTIPLHRIQTPRLGQTLKRALDILLSGLVIVLLAPLVLAIAIAIKLDSPGPVHYSSERVGKKGCRFRCLKFRTMVRDADERRNEVLHMNERDSVLFKAANDPRITRIGRFLRKYSLDELPQFINVLRGEMSVVGPRPPLASEVKKYKLSHLRRLDVMPGITGLWQVQARQDASFESYISLDIAYIENWSIWLDLKIIARTVGVVFAGTGT
jgi:exopolysaccharide biosynthesis polyprenyl glycosylphosphotransferase